MQVGAILEERALHVAAASFASAAKVQRLVNVADEMANELECFDSLPAARALVADHHVKYDPGERQMRVQRHPHDEKEPTMFSREPAPFFVLG